jgi:fructokinase
MKILAYGEILWDIIEGNEHLGGAPFNFAAHSAKCGAESYIVSRLGDDYLGMRAFNQCNKNGVDSSFIQWDEDFPTGTVIVSLVNGQPDYSIQKEVAFDHIAADPIIAALKKLSFDVFYFGTLSQRSEVSAATLKGIINRFKFKHVFCDVNLRKGCYSKIVITESLKWSTIFKLNLDEVTVISEILFNEQLTHEAFCNAICFHFPQIATIVITASEKGCYVFNSGHLSHVPGMPVVVLDAVGAGDAFSAAFMHRFGVTGNAISSAEIANRIGAFVATKHGAIPDYPEELRSLLKGNQTFSNAT